ncbi:MAG: hypothetical protein MUE49_06555 [Rhodospirillales bacterium]|nr:hypothetical protein [Rhodospirillales bacterium]
MSIRSTVGVGGVNATADVRLVQILLNAGLARVDHGRRLVVDGIVGPATEAAIHRFQRHAMGQRRPTGCIEPADQTLEALRDALPAQVLAETLHATMPDATTKDICRFYKPLRDALRAHGISSPKRRAHFFAQIGEESRDLSSLVASMPANGDTCPDPEAERYRARGLLPLAGRAAYARYHAARGHDVVADPHRLATDAAVAADAAGWFWAVSGSNAHADGGDLVAITEVITGGRHRLTERQDRLRRALWLLSV